MKPGDGQVDFWQKNSFLYAGNAPFIEALYEDFLENPESVPVQWRKIFEGWRTEGSAPEFLHRHIIEELTQKAKHKTTVAATVSSPQQSLEKQIGVMQLITAYRLRGHQQAHLDPLNLSPRPEVPDLELEYHGLGEGDLDAVFQQRSRACPVLVYVISFLF